MNTFFQAAGAVMIAVILILTLGKQGKDMAVLLSIVVCCMTIALAAAYLSPVMDFLQELQTMGGLDSQLLRILFKIVGIGMVTEVAVLVCNESGNGSLGKSLQILGTAVILWLSIPVFRALLELIQKILGDV